MTFTVDFLTPKSNQHIYDLKYICDQNRVKFFLLVFEIWFSEGFRDAQTHSLTDGRTDDVNAECPLLPPAPTSLHTTAAITVQNISSPLTV